MAEAGGWIVAVLVAVVAVLVRCIEKGRSRAAVVPVLDPSGRIVAAHRQAIIDEAEDKLARITGALEGDDPEGDTASASDEARADR